MTPLQGNILRMFLSAAIIVLCILSLTRVMPPIVGIPIAMALVGVLSIFSGWCSHKEKKGGAMMLVILGIVLIIFAAIAPFLK